MGEIIHHRPVRAMAQCLKCGNVNSQLVVICTGYAPGKNYAVGICSACRVEGPRVKLADNVPGEDLYVYLAEAAEKAAEKWNEFNKVPSDVMAFFKKRLEMIGKLGTECYDSIMERLDAEWSNGLHREEAACDEEE